MLNKKTSFAFLLLGASAVFADDTPALRTRDLTGYGGSCGTYEGDYLKQWQKSGKKCYNYECKTGGNIDEVKFFDKDGKEIATERTEPWWVGQNNGDSINCLDKCPSEVVKVKGFYKGRECFNKSVNPKCPPDQAMECGTFQNCKLEQWTKYGKKCYNYECKTVGKIDQVKFFDKKGNVIATERTEPWWYGQNEGDRPTCLDKCPSEVVKVKGFYKGRECFNKSINPNCPSDCNKCPGGYKLRTGHQCYYTKEDCEEDGGNRNCRKQCPEGYQFKPGHRCYYSSEDCEKKGGWDDNGNHDRDKNGNDHD